MSLFAPLLPSRPLPSTSTHRHLDASPAPPHMLPRGTPDSDVEQLATALRDAKLALDAVVSRIRAADAADPGVWERVSHRAIQLDDAGQSSPSEPFLDAGPGGFDLSTCSPSQLFASDWSTFDVGGANFSYSQAHDSFGSAFTCSSSTGSTSPHSLFMSSLDSDHSSGNSSWSPQSQPLQSFEKMLGFDVACAPDWGSAPPLHSPSALASAGLFGYSTYVPEASTSLLPLNSGRERTLSRSESLRFSPMCRPPPISPTLLPFDSPTSSFLPISNLSLSSPVISTLPSALSRSGSKSSSAGGSSRKTSIKRRGAAEDACAHNSQQKRRAREFVDPMKEFPTNSEHLFFVFTQTKSNSPPDISSKNIRQLYINNPPPESTLARVMPAGAYTRADCINDTTPVYAFNDDNGTNYIVQYNAGLSTSIFPVTTDPDDSLRTFVHFPPHTMVTSTVHPVGSGHWWRLQSCESGIPHDGMPGDGSWTARYDASPTERRPARIVDHFAKCPHRDVEGTFCPTRKMALAIMTFNTTN